MQLKLLRLHGVSCRRGLCILFLAAQDRQLNSPERAPTVGFGKSATVFVTCPTLGFEPLQWGEPLNLTLCGFQAVDLIVGADLALWTGDQRLACERQAICKMATKHATCPGKMGFGGSEVRSMTVFQWMPCTRASRN